jgi:UDP-N-acetylglucosamine 4,6-dehydratase
MFKNKILLITGGTGSFGNAVLNFFSRLSFKEIRIFSRDEKKQDDMRKLYKNDLLKFYVGDVRDYDSIDSAMKNTDFVFHAAALKQVPSCEFYPLEAVKTNILGTENVLNSGIYHRVKKIICLSTDKAVYPINAMGISKAMMEKVIIAKSKESNSTTIAITRYGNVMNSRGSVIPLFMKQILDNKNLTLTNLNMTRFLMSLDDAVKLVLFAFQNGKNGNIFVPKTPAASIKNIAAALISLFNSKKGFDIIGTRHGEKDHETLISKEEMFSVKNIKGYYVIKPDNRNLNYKPYFIEGKKIPLNIGEYSSEKVKHLNINEIKKLFKKLSFINYVLKNKAFPHSEN